MSGEGIGAIGEAVTGGLAARAVEPAAGEEAGEVQGTCLNCRTELIGPHCHRCGQAAHVHRTLSAWWHDLAHGILHLDGKIWRTLPLLAWRPGQLTRRYVEGERANFVSPLALFLFSVFLMFALMSALGASLMGDASGIQKGFAEEVAQADAKIKVIEKQRAGDAAAGRPVGPIDAKLKAARDEARLLREMRDRGVVKGASVRMADDVPGWLRGPVEKAAQNPSLLLYKLQTNAYKFSWALIPISMPLLWVLFLHRARYRQRFKAYDHIVFVTYSISFMSMGTIAVVLLDRLGFPGLILGLAAMIVPPVHMYRQLRGAYGLSAASALWRTVALLFFASWALSLFGLLLVALGLLG